MTENVPFVTMLWLLKY